MAFVLVAAVSCVSLLAPAASAHLSVPQRFEEVLHRSDAAWWVTDPAPSTKDDPGLWRPVEEYWPPLLDLLPKPSSGGISPPSTEEGGSNAPQTWIAIAAVVGVVAVILFVVWRRRAG